MGKIRQDYEETELYIQYMIFEEGLKRALLNAFCDIGILTTEGEDRAYSDFLERHKNEDLSGLIEELEQ